MEDLVVDDNHVLLSLDVSSLFTNVRCDLVLKSLDRRCQLIHNNCRIPFDEIINCTKFLFENTYFTFNNNIYLQFFGTLMDSPILRLFADIVMDDLENDCLRILKDKHNCSPLFDYRFLDDTILCVQKKFIDLVLNIFNSQDKNLQFTFEVEQNNQNNFLDLSLIIKENQIISNWFQKPTSSNRTINYFSNHPIYQKKKNIVYNLVDRAISLSHKTFHNVNLKIVKEILLNNDYPNSFTDRNIKIRMNKIKYSSPNSLNKKNRSDL